MKTSEFFSILRREKFLYPYDLSGSVRIVTELVHPFRPIKGICLYEIIIKPFTFLLVKRDLVLIPYELRDQGLERFVISFEVGTDGRSDCS